MGLRVSIYRDGYGNCSNGGLSSLVNDLTIVNVKGPQEPTKDAPAARLVERTLGNRRAYYVEPVEQPRDALGPMMGGCYVGTSDSRWSEATGTYGAIPLHDRFETPAQYRSLSI